MKKHKKVKQTQDLVVRREVVRFLATNTLTEVVAGCATTGVPRGTTSICG